MAEQTFYTRVAEAASAGAPVGASINIARASRSNSEAGQVGAMFAQAGQAFFQPGVTLDANRTVVREEPERPKGFWDHVGGFVSGIGRPVLRALEWGTEATGNLTEASLRTLAERSRDGFQISDILTPFTANPIWGWTQGDWRRNWDKAVAAEASVGQTAWLIAEQGLADKGWIEPGTSGSGVIDPATGEIVGPRIRSGGLDLLDDPNRREERQEYFSEGAAHWTTGVGDALWQIVMDPLLVVGKGASAVRASRATLTAEDVARAADATVDAAQLTGRQRRARDLVTRLAEAFEEAGNQAGAVTALSRSRLLRESSDGAAIAYFMSRAGEGVDDAAERIARRADVLYAGMGDSAALGRVAERSSLLELELRKMMAPLDDAEELLTRVGVDDAALVVESIARQNDAPLAVREVAEQMSSIRKELDAARRVMEVGRPVSDVARAPGELAGNIPLTSFGVARQTARVVKTIQNGAFLSPIHIVVGRHLPGTFKLSDDDSINVFREAVRRASTVARGTGDRAQEFRRRLLELEDSYLVAGSGATAKAPRGNVIGQFDRLVDEMIAVKHGVWKTDKNGAPILDAAGRQVPDVEAIQAIHGSIRGRRAAMLREISTRVYKARSAGEVATIRDSDGVYALSDELADSIGRPVLQSQVEDFVSILDPRQLDKFATAHYSGGLAGYFRKGTTSGAAQLTAEALAAGNRLWKFGALLRPGAYFVRAQLDEQLRMLAMLGPLKWMATAARGLGNTLFNLRKMDADQVRALTARMYAGRRIDNIELRLRMLGEDPAAAAPTPLTRVESLTNRLAELRIERSTLKFNRVRHDPDTLQSRLANLDDRIAKAKPGTKSRANLEAQRARLVQGSENQQRALALDDEIRELQSQIDELKTMPRDEVTALREELATLRAEMAKPLTWTRSGEKVRVRGTDISRRLGQSSRISRSGKYKGPRVYDAYLGRDDYLRVKSQVNAEDAFLGLMTGGTRGQIDALRRTGRWDSVPGTDPSWESAMLQAVNHQVRSDALGQRILAGQTDAEILRWFRETREGAAYLRSMYHTGQESAHVVIDRARQHISTLLPEGSPLRATALERAINLDDLKSAWKVPSERPHVPGELLSAEARRGPVALYEHLERSYFKWVAEMPEEMMARHPFYAARFEMHVRNLVRNSDLDDTALTLQQFNEIRAVAARKARKDVERYLFDTTKQTNIGHMLRFLSPFYGAWEDTMVKWARIFSENPATLVGGWDVLRAPNAAGMVVDENGNLIGADGKIRDSDGNVLGEASPWDGYVLLPIPDWSIPGVGNLRERTGANKVRIAKKSANVTFQGDPWWLPGPGPIAAIPANELIVTMFPEAWGEEGAENPILKYLLPYGPTSDSAIEQLMPSWARAAVDVLSQDGRRVDAVFTQLYMEQVALERNGLAEPMTEQGRLDLIANRTRNWTILRWFGTQMPMTWAPESRLGYYKSEYNRYRREYGADADEMFRRDYPDYFDMAISLTANETGLSATDESWGAIQAYRSDMAAHPEYGWFWAGAANLAGGFSQGVYHAQLRNEVGPGTSTHFRSRRDPLEVARQSAVDQGWRTYQQFSEAIRLKLEERGLRSINQRGAEDLAEMRREFIASLSDQNPQWAAAYNEGGNPGKVSEFLSLAYSQLASHPELAQRGDGQALLAYLQVREAVRTAMAARGTSSIEAAANADLKAIWDEFTGTLVQADIGFGQMWDRVLDRDDLTADVYGVGVGA